MPRHGPIDSLAVPRTAGIRTMMRLPLVPDADDADVAFMGIPFDVGATWRTGQRFAPAAIRDASQPIRRYHPILDIDVYRTLSVVDAGDAPFPAYGPLEKIEAAVAALPCIPILLGGDNLATLAHLRALYRRHGPLALVQFDAHTDCWDAYFGNKFTHGTWVKRACEEGLLDVEHSIQVGLRGSGYGADDYQTVRDLGLEYITARQLRREGFDRVRQRVQGARAVFIDFDIDCVDPAWAPGTGYPEIAGPSPAEIQDVLYSLEGVNIVGADIVEVLPSQDPTGITSILAANIAFDMLALMAHYKRNHVVA